MKRGIIEGLAGNFAEWSRTSIPSVHIMSATHLQLKVSPHPPLILSLMYFKGETAKIRMSVAVYKNLYFLIF